MVDSYEPDCKSDDDKGWPRFNSVYELRASRWSTYFLEIYGGLPVKYPVCVHDFWWLDDKALERANITGLTPVDWQGNLSEGDLMDTRMVDYSGHPGGFGIYHEVYKPAGNHMWIEIMHTTFPTETETMWCWRTRGSGVWFNTGNTMTFPTQRGYTKLHREAQQYLRDGCTAKISLFLPQYEADIFGPCAREKGLDSIQFAAVANVKPLQGPFGLPGITELVITGNKGRYNCGSEHASETTLRSGWKASEKCDCENLPVDPTCGIALHGNFPWIPPFASPIYCELQRYTFWKACDAKTCSRSSCKISHQQDVATTMEKDVAIVAV